MQLQILMKREPQTRIVTDAVLDDGWRFANPVLRRFHAVWRVGCADGRLPGRAAIDPAGIADLMPYVMLVDVLRDEEDGVAFRSRLVGEAHLGIDGRAAAGEVLFRNPDEADEMAEVAATGRPRYSRCRVEHLPGAGEYERATFPLSSDGVEVDAIATLLVPCEAAPRSRLHALFSWL